jgi:hypothetical protein
MTSALLAWAPIYMALAAILVSIGRVRQEVAEGRKENSETKAEVKELAKTVTRQGNALSGIQGEMRAARGSYHPDAPTSSAAE